MNSSEPLMFIDSAQKINDNHKKQIFDSRYYVKKEVINEVYSKEIDKITLEKLLRITTLSQKDIMVWCKIIVGNAFYEGIPVEVKDEQLSLKQESTSVLIDIKDIDDVIILNIQGS